jgi:alpha-glucoside transport system substrate-binding protein
MPADSAPRTGGFAHFPARSAMPADSAPRTGGFAHFPARSAMPADSAPRTGGFAPPRLRARGWPARRLARICLTLVLAAAGLASCSGGDRTGVVSVLGPWTGAEEASFRAMVEPFEASTGIRVRYEGVRDLDAVLTGRLRSGTPPDLVALSTPGELRDLSARGALLSLDPVLDRGQTAQQYSPAWLRLGQDRGQQKAIFVKAALKGLVWYSPPAFRAAGYQRPADWNDLVGLTRRIRAAGGTPWCLGLESSSTSGWPGTDWVEDILLHQAGPDAYRRWWQGTLSWRSPEIRRAWQTWGELVAAPGAVAGGPLGALLTNFGDAGNGMFGSPPRCTLDHAGSFITGFYQRAGRPLAPGRDFDAFRLPRPDDRYTSAQEVAGDLLGMFRDTPAARQLVRYIATPRAQQIWVGRGGAISPNSQVSPDAYPDPVSRELARIAVGATEVDFDASDLMPTTMQTAFYQAVLAYVSNPGRLDDLLADLDGVRGLAY